MDKNKSAPINLGALINKTDLIITIVLIIIISVLWFETKNFEKALYMDPENGLSTNR